MYPLLIIALLIVFGAISLLSAEPGRRSAVLEFVRENPRQLDVYRRRVESVAAEMDVPAARLADSPTLLAMEGLTELAAGRIAQARQVAMRLDAKSKMRGEALTFPLDFDFASVWPYSIKAPWLSALVQGLALSLFTQLHVATQEPLFADRAKRIALSYEIPLSDGGFTRTEPDGLQFEEYPGSVPSRVLNGGAIAT